MGKCRGIKVEGKHMAAAAWRSQNRAQLALRSSSTLLQRLVARRARLLRGLPRAEEGFSEPELRGC